MGGSASAMVRTLSLLLFTGAPLLETVTVSGTTVGKTLCDDEGRTELGSLAFILSSIMEHCLLNSILSYQEVCR